MILRCTRILFSPRLYSHVEFPPLPWLHERALVSISPYTRVKAKVSDLLKLLKMDVVYDRAEGDWLYFQKDGREIKILDLVGGFGSLLLGHNHPELVAEAKRLLEKGAPIHVQGSQRSQAGLLAEELNRRVDGDFRVVLTNSGTEAIEAAMKHAMLETNCRTFIALEGAFHGKTLGAVQLTNLDTYRGPFLLEGLEVLRVEPGNIKQLEEKFNRTNDLAGFIYEPIQGEGGVRTLDRAFLQRAAELCREKAAPMIADEIQTGVGRTGAFLASEELGIQPDYIALSKALGGGLAKVAALMIRAEAYKPDFDLKHTSTYAEDDFSSAIALKTLKLVDGKVLEDCREKGARLLSGLQDLAKKYPEIVAGVRGRGLMIGFELQPLSRSRSFLLRLLSAQNDLALMLAGYLFNQHQIRIFNTLSDPFTLRIQPSHAITGESIEKTIQAFSDVCARLKSGDSLGLTGHLMRGKEEEYADELSLGPDVAHSFWNEPQFRKRESNPPPIRVGWLCHLIDAESFPPYEPQFRSLSFDKREKYLQHMAPRVAPVVLNAVDIQSKTGKKVRLHAILLPFTSGSVRKWMDRHQLNVAQRHVSNGIETARSLGCQIVALGQYTSMVTYNGTKVKGCGLSVTTGNSYTAALAIQALERAHEESPRPAEASVLAVVGALGNIGRACTEILAPRYRKTILVGSGRPGAMERMKEFAQRIPNVEIANDLWAIQAADVVVSATNATDSPLGPDHFARNAIVCDLSVPSTVHPQTWGERPDLLQITGGVCKLPSGEDVEVPGFPLPAGQTYGCMSEGLLMGFENHFESNHIGKITSDVVHWTQKAAQKHGFRLADFKNKSVLGTDPQEENHAITF